MSCGVGHRCGSVPMLLWLWWRPAATAPIRPLAQEPPNAGLEKTKKKRKEKKEKGKKKKNKQNLKSAEGRKTQRSKKKSIK